MKQQIESTTYLKLKLSKNLNCLGDSEANQQLHCGPVVVPLVRGAEADQGGIPSALRPATERSSGGAFPLCEATLLLL